MAILLHLSEIENSYLEENMDKFTTKPNESCSDFEANVQISSFLELFRSRVANYTGLLESMRESESHSMQFAHEMDLDVDLGQLILSFLIIPAAFYLFFYSISVTYLGKAHTVNLI